MIDNGLYQDKEVLRHSSIASFVLAAASPTLVAQASAKRVRITFVSGNQSVVIVGQQNPIDNSRGIIIGVGTGAVALDKDMYGSLLQGNWFAQAISGTPNFSVIDTVET